jgi:hypothetical protein
MGGKCGSCTACCRVFAIQEFKKPAGKWCRHCAIGDGCRIYDRRPSVCTEFTCVWLESFGHLTEGLPPEARPDKCKVVFSATTKDGLISGTVMPGYPDAWRRGAAKWMIDRMVGGGLSVVVGLPASTSKVMIDRYGEREVEMTEPDERGMQWSISE